MKSSIRDLWGKLTEKKAMNPETRETLLSLSGIYDQRRPPNPSEDASEHPEETPRGNPSDPRRE
jgi:hypothetical protein